ncbi:MAG TPA: VOC family protein [Vicinamibacterales bacterium]|nr:VOC family protein [Vicinamibacterales bacterium]
MRLDYAIVFVSDMSRAVSFYRDALGLSLRFQTSHWTELETEGTTLALHLATSPASVAADARDEPAGRCRPGFSVPNLDEFHARMLERNVPCLQEPRQVSGARIAKYLDPDGLVIPVSDRRAG